MRIDVAVKIIIALLVVMIASLVSVIVLMNEDGKGVETTGSDPEQISTSTNEESSDDLIVPPDTSEQEDTSLLDTSESSDTSESDTTEPDTSESDTTEPDTSESDTTEPDTSESDTTEPDEEGVPDDFSLNTTLRSNTGTKLNLLADVTASAHNGRVKVVITVSLEHYTLNASSKSCTLVIGDDTITFSSAKINYSGSKHKTVIYTHEGLFDYGQTIDIFAEYPFDGTYSGIEVDDIRVTGQIILE